MWAYSVSACWFESISWSHLVLRSFFEPQQRTEQYHHRLLHVSCCRMRPWYGCLPWLPLKHFLSVVWLYVLTFLWTWLRFVQPDSMSHQQSSCAKLAHYRLSSIHFCYLSSYTKLDQQCLSYDSADYSHSSPEASIIFRRYFGSSTSFSVTHEISLFLPFVPQLCQERADITLGCLDMLRNGKRPASWTSDISS